MQTPFTFLRPGKLVDEDLELVLTRTVEADPTKHHVPMYEFDLRHSSQLVTMGKVRLRIGSARALRYHGHIGYEVRQRFRGHRYAARSCQLLLPLAMANGPSTFRVGEVTSHLLTNISVIRSFVERDIACQGACGQPGTVSVH